MAHPSDAALAFVPDSRRGYKLMYLPQRNPALAAEEFPEAWRSHSRFASQFATTLGSHFRSVHQCVKDRAGGLTAGFDNDRDGCAILALKSWEDLLAARYHPVAAKELLEDEVRVFSGFVDQWTMAVEEQLLADGDHTTNVLLSFLRRRDGIDPARFREASRDAAQRLKEGAAPPVRLVWSAVVDPAVAFAFDAVIEAWYPDRESALASARDPAQATMLEQATLADPEQGIRLLARLNLSKRTESAGAATSWTSARDEAGA